MPATPTTVSGKDSADVATLDLFLDEMDRVRKAAKKDQRFAFDLPWKVFIRYMRMLTPQSYGTRIQNYLANFYGWTTVKSSLNRGDVTDAAGRYQEVKVTLITSSNPDANFVQLRPYQDIDGYHCFVIDPSYKVFHFVLTKQQMATEIASLGNYAHGTEASADKNTNAEYAVRFKWTPGAGTTKRWVNTYLSSGKVPV